MQVWSLGWEDPLEEELAIHSSILAWKIAWTEEPGQLQFIGSHRVGHDWSNLAHTFHLLLYSTFQEPHLQKIHVCILSCSVWSFWYLFATSRTVAHQASLSMELSRQKYWSELPIPPPGDLPNPGIKLNISCIGRWILHHWATWKAPEKTHDGNIISIAHILRLISSIRKGLKWKK